MDGIGMGGGTGPAISVNGKDLVTGVLAVFTGILVNIGIIEQPILQDDPTIIETPFEEQNPTIIETPIEEQSPTILDTPIVDQSPTVIEQPIIQQVPTILTNSRAGWTANDFLYEGLTRQGLTSISPTGFKEYWSSEGFDYQVRAHPADPTYGKTGSIYRVGRRLQGTDANGQGFGWEYADSVGNWFPTKVLNPKNTDIYNPKAAEDTHIQLP
jgi:hypothetical protein